MTDERRKAAEELVEQVASLLHEIWSEWFLHQYQNSTDENVRRWMEQCLTGYSDLSENDKDKDRKLAQPIVEMILAGQECGEARAAAEIAALREAVRCVYFRRDNHGGMLDTRADGGASIDALSDEAVAAVRRALEAKR